jgi:uroporphyrinogen-III synthase
MSTKTIVITRPSGQAHQLSALLNECLQNSPTSQAKPPEIISLPLLTILPGSGSILAQDIAASLHAADLAIFVSPNAIECTMRLLGCSWQEVSNSPVPIGVMGGGSLAALSAYGIGSESTPTWLLYPQDNTEWDSEGLWKVLQKLQWDWPTKRVVILKGEGGRDWLADTLKAAGAHLNLISVYSRIPLDLESPIWGDIRKIDFAQSLWLLTSSEAVRHLGRAQLPLNLSVALCSHPNIADAARQIGFREIIVCESGDDALVKASQHWLEQQ